MPIMMFLEKYISKIVKYIHDKTRFIKKAFPQKICASGYKKSELPVLHQLKNALHSLGKPMSEINSKNYFNTDTYCPR